jgi:hypothetical protein
MTKIALPIALLSLGACSIFGGGDDVGTKPPSTCDRGVFHPGPYKDPTTGKSCSSPGGLCSNDGQCHSSAQKCPCKK